MSRHPPRNYDHLLKIIVIGDYLVGKTNIVLRFTDNIFPASMSTIGVDFRVKTVIIDNQRVKLQLWDFRFGERRIFLPSYFRGATCAIIVYDCTKKKSFEDLVELTETVNRHMDEVSSKIIIGNKCDLSDQKQVDFETAKEFADNLGFPFFEVSALTGENIEEAFVTAAVHALRSSELKKQTVGSIPPVQPSKRSCAIT